MTQPDLFSNYSYATSLPAYLDTSEIKNETLRRMFECIKANGSMSLLEVSERIKMPQAICSARMSDKNNPLKYEGFTSYNNRKRKLIVINI